MVRYNNLCIVCYRGGHTLIVLIWKERRKKREFGGRKLEINIEYEWEKKDVKEKRM